MHNNLKSSKATLFSRDH